MSNLNLLTDRNHIATAEALLSQFRVNDNVRVSHWFDIDGERVERVTYGIVNGFSWGPGGTHLTVIIEMVGVGSDTLYQWDPSDPNDWIISRL